MYLLIVFILNNCAEWIRLKFELNSRKSMENITVKFVLLFLYSGTLSLTLLKDMMYCILYVPIKWPKSGHFCKRLAF